ncbi:MAG TPA: hypothetical protein VFW71_11405 [Actinomycetota bacterium]|nr:hypothetical protein [Actinomycetota bacterium]
MRVCGSGAKNWLRAGVAVLALAVGLVAGVVAAPLAAQARRSGRGGQAGTLAAGKALCDAAVARRTADLAALKVLVDGAASVTATDRATLDTNIATHVSGLNSLRGVIDADATLPALRADCAKIVTEHYVYVFLIPQTRLVVAVDRVQAAATALTKLQGLLQQDAAAAQRKGKDVTSADGSIDELANKAKAALQYAGQAETSVLPLSASGYPGNKPTLVAARSAMGTARDALSGALTDAKAAISALRHP